MKEFWKTAEWIIPCVILLIGYFLICSWATANENRYPVGQPVPVSVYTEPYDPCDPAYKFLQAPPKDWAEKFGANERTMLLHAVSELRVVVAAQGKRLMALEILHKDELAPKDSNEAK